MAFSVGQLQFLDSYQFIPESLEKLVETLKDDEFVYTRREFPNEEQFQFVKRKGIFSYDYLDHISKIKSTKEVKKFFNKLSDAEVCKNDYLRGKLIFNKYCKTFGDYHDMYLKTDVLLLEDLFEKCRETCLFNCQIDQSHYFSTAGFA